MIEKIRISLAAARVNANLTQDEVSKTIKVSKATIVSWENGRTMPTADIAEKLANLYRLPMDFINFATKV